MNDTTIIVIPNWMITIFVIYATLDGLRILLGFGNEALAWMVSKKQPSQEANAPCKTCVALARAIMLDQTSHDTKPKEGTAK